MANWCLDMRTGETLLIADHSESLGRPENNYQLGPVLDWFPDGRALLFGGRAVIDRRTGKVVHQLPTNIYWMDPKRILRADHKLDMLPNPAGTGRLYQSVPFARDELDKALATVAAGGEAVDTGLPPLTEVKLSEARSIGLPGDDLPWTVTADRRPAAAGEFRSKILLGRFGATGERPQDRLDGVEIRRLMFSSPASAIAVAHQELRSDYHRQRRQVLTRHELRSGRMTGSLPIPDDYRLIDVSPSGNLALTGLANPVGAYPRLDIIQLTAKQHLAGWRPYSAEPWAEDPHPTGQPVPRNPQTVRWAWFVDEQHVVTVNPTGKLVCWQLPDCRAVYVCDPFGEPLAQSAGRRYVAGFENSAMHILDATTGQWAGRLPLPEPAEAMSRVAFRADGQELTAIVRRPLAKVMHVLRWVLSSGQPGESFPIPYNLVSPYWNDYGRPDRAQIGLEYRGDRYVMLDDRPLLDLTNRTAIWRYSIRLGGFAVGSPDDRSWYFCRHETQAPQGQLFEMILTSAETPDAFVRQETAAVQLMDQCALAPGQPIRVEVDLAAAQLSSSDQECQQAFEQLLRGRSFVIDPAASRVLSITATEQETGAQLRLMRRVEQPPVRLDIPQRQIEIQLTVALNGQPLWNSACRDTTRSQEIRTADPAAEVLDDLRRRTRSLLTRSESLAERLPEYVFPAGAAGSLPGSILHVEGAQPQPERVVE